MTMPKENPEQSQSVRDPDWHDHMLAQIDPKDERRRMYDNRQDAKKRLGMTEAELDAAFGIRSRMR